MGVLSIISSILKPVKGILDEVITSKEEKANISLRMMQIEAMAMRDALEYERSILKQQASIVRAEAKGEGWLQRSWRPVTMLTFLVLIVMDIFGYTHFRLPHDAWTVLQGGLIGYVGGRSVEKVGLPIVKAWLDGRAIDKKFTNKKRKKE